MKYRTILLYGPPGSGKGTWGKVLGNMPGFYHLSSGDMFRNLDVNSEIGALCMSYINNGKLVPDDVTLRLWKETMKKLITAGRFDAENGTLLLDGIPRNLAQAQAVNSSLDVRLIFSFDCADREILVARLKRRAIIERRADDTDEETIRYRLTVYDKQTHAVLQYYPPEKAARIDVSRAVPDILHQVSSALMERLPALMAPAEKASAPGREPPGVD